MAPYSPGGDGYRSCLGNIMQLPQGRKNEVEKFTPWHINSCLTTVQVGLVKNFTPWRCNFLPHRCFGLNFVKKFPLVCYITSCFSTVPTEVIRVKTLGNIAPLPHEVGKNAFGIFPSKNPNTFYYKTPAGVTRNFSTPFLFFININIWAYKS